MRSVIGSVILVIWVGVYALAAMLLAVAILPGQSVFFQTVYYVVAGLIWVVPAMAIVWWITAQFRAQKPD